ncbi:MAG: methionine adenosyltransferase [Halanaeroarchaeum sp.]
MTIPPFSITHLDRDPVASRPMEFVERKGIGHPDSLCDGIAEAVSRRLSRYYRDEFGEIPHHNTDKVQLVAGSTDPEFGGGEIVDPIYVLVGGRATREYRGQEVPVDALATDAAREYVEDNVPNLPAEGIEFESRIGETSPGLRSLFDDDGTVRANDTSVGVGYAPLSETDRIVRELEPEVSQRIPAVGEDVKVMAWRTNDDLHVTVAAAVVSRYVSGVDEYLEVTARIEELVEAFVTDRTDRTVHVAVNAADDPESGAVYLTETGLSAEMGDDGNVGRGNRVNGLITPHRPMSLEAAAGKNPVSHVGKLYNLVATNATERVEAELDAEFARVSLLSRIGAPVTEPRAVDVETTTRDDEAVRRIVRAELETVESLTNDLVAGDVPVF